MHEHVTVECTVDGLSPTSETRASTSTVYRPYYLARGADRNCLATNPGVVLQTAAAWISLIRAVQRAGIDPSAVRVLDIGGAGGGSLLPWLELGACPGNLVAVDSDPARIEHGRARLAHVRFQCADARRLDYPDASFDVVTESTLFMTLTDDTVASLIAAEMVRVTKPGGWILLRDWCMRRPRDRSMAPLTIKRLHSLFAVGTGTDLKFSTAGALTPPVGRFLSRYAGWAYGLVQAACPPLVGMRCYALRRR